ncbi:MAG: hypothetical protein KAT00_04745 [Planctomycetes bacterium]|nr:hypothetical protein [Planctomycetota bacterium]
MRLNAFNYFMTALMAFVAGASIGFYVFVFKSADDGLDDWKQSQGLYMTEVVYGGERYYCDHAESPAGFLDRLILYRGEHSHLVLPDKYAVMELPPLQDVEVVSDE